MEEQDEILELVNNKDAVVGTISRREAWQTKAQWVRVINAFVVNARGELWIPRRSASKEMFPLCLDMSVGGHVGAGESYETAFIREAQEELNVDVTTLRYRELGYLHPAEHELSAFMKVYELELDETPPYNEADFVSADWVRSEVLLKRLANGEAAKGDLEKLVKLFYA